MNVEKCTLSVEAYQITAHLLSSKDGKVFEAYSVRMDFDGRDDTKIIQSMTPVGFERSRLPILEYDRESNEIKITYRLDRLTMEEVISRNDFAGAQVQYQEDNFDYKGEIAECEYQDGRLQLRLFPAYRRDHLEGESQSLYDEWYSNCLLDKSESCFQIENLREEPDGKVSFTAKDRAVGRVIIAFKPKE